MSTSDLLVTIEPDSDPLDTAPEGPVAVRVDVASEHIGELPFVAQIPLLGYEQLDVVEDWALQVQEQPLSELGQALFDATLGPWGQWGTLRTMGHRIRIRVRTSSSLIAAQPWEVLHSAQHGGFLGLDANVSITRNAQRLAPARPFAASRPLRVLLVGSTPVDLGPINVAGELDALSSILAGLGGGVEAALLTQDVRVCRFEDLRNALDHYGPWHIVHFSGHGGFDPTVGGMLAFTDATGTRDLVSAHMVGKALGAHPALRLVILNACRGAMGAGRKAVDSVAGALVNRGVPACISMQFEVSDTAALPFAETLHGGLVTHGDVERAVEDARRVVSETPAFPGDPARSMYRSTEWATPVLHLEGDSQLFPPSDSAANAPAVARGPVIVSSGPAPVTNPGGLEEVGRMHWRLTYETELDPAQALQRAEAGVRATMDVRKLKGAGGGFEAKVGGVFPGAWAATERVTAQVAGNGGRTTVTVESRPLADTQLADQGRSRQALERLAAYPARRLRSPSD